MKEFSCGGIRRRISIASITLEREQNLEIRWRSGGEIVSGEEETSLDLAFRRLIGECGGVRLVNPAKRFAEPRGVRGEAIRAAVGDERARLTFLRRLR